MPATCSPTWYSGTRSRRPSGCCRTWARRLFSAASCSASSAHAARAPRSCYGRKVAGVLFQVGRAAAGNAVTRHTMLVGENLLALPDVLPLNGRTAAPTDSSPAGASRRAESVGGRLHHLGRVVPHIHCNIGQGLVVQPVFQRQFARVALARNPSPRKPRCPPGPVPDRSPPPSACVSGRLRS